MSPDSDGRDDPPMSEVPYEVGYKRPPLHTRFKKGQSGNAKGRPKGARNRPAAASRNDVRAIFLKEAHRKVPINDANGTVTVSMAEAVARSLAVAAAKGNVRAQRSFLDLLHRFEKEEREERAEVLIAIGIYKLEWDREFKRCKALGIKPPDPVIHPDDLDVDPVTGELRFQPPLTLKANRTELETARDTFEQELNELTAQLGDSDGNVSPEVAANIARTGKALSLARAALDGDRAAIRALNRAETPGEDDCGSAR